MEANCTPFATEAQTMCSVPRFESWLILPTEGYFRGIQFCAYFGSGIHHPYCNHSFDISFDAANFADIVVEWYSRHVTTFAAHGSLFHREPPYV